MKDEHLKFENFKETVNDIGDLSNSNSNLWAYPHIIEEEEDSKIEIVLYTFR